MLAEIKPDVVSLCTYVGLRRQMIEACAAAGVKAIVAEKPFLASPVECVAIRKLVADSGIKISVAHARRYLPVMTRARQLIDSGAIGKVRLTATAVTGWDLNEMGAHWVDLIRYFHGDQPITWVLGQARVRQQRGFGHAMEDHAVSYFHFADGSRGLVDAGVAMAGPDNFTIAGTEGIIHILDEDRLVLQNKEGQIEENHRQTEPAGWAQLPKRSGTAAVGWEKAWDCLVGTTLSWIEGGPEPLTGFTSSIQTCEATLATYASAALGDRVDLPLSGPAAEINEYPVEILARRAAK
jgi:predicted dehydrogenase